MAGKKGKRLVKVTDPGQVIRDTVKKVGKSLGKGASKVARKVTRPLTRKKK